MSFGWWEYKLQRCPLSKLYSLIFGVTDLHSHIRFRAIKKLFKHKTLNVEVGAGEGIMSIGFSYTIGKPIIALTYTTKEFKQLKFKIKKLGLDNVIKVGRDDAQAINSVKEKWSEQVLLIDVLEHVYNDLEALRQINKILIEDGYLIISCPTPYYPKYFGLDFDKAIGHLRYYTLTDLKRLLEKTGFKILDYYYYTNSVSSLLCMIFYARIRNKFIRFLLMPILNALSLLFEKESKYGQQYSSFSYFSN